MTEALIYARIIFVGLCLSLFVNGAGTLIGVAFATVPEVFSSHPILVSPQ